MDTYFDRLKELTAKRDEVNARIAPVQVELDEANLQVERAQTRANDLARQIDEARGGRAWVELKREISMLTRALGNSHSVPTSAPIEFVAQELPAKKKGLFSRFGF